jgi:4-carboxymuconolactone decarboxylase
MSEYAGDWPTHERFEEGLKVRRAVVGEARVRTALESADNLSKPLQELVTSYAWGEIWTRPGLEPQIKIYPHGRHAYCPWQAQ